MATLQPGQHIGSYQIERELGSGGFGSVYLAVHGQIGRRVAIKILHPRYARDPAVARRFLDEARAVNVIGHPNIVAITDMGQLDDGAAYMVMEYLEGQPLSARLRWGGGRLGHATLRFARQIASALATAHDQGIIHRDLKPDNVMIVSDPETPTGERVKVLDFGIAKLLETHGAGPPGAANGADALTGEAEGPMGTPAYMSPEQCRGGAFVVDGRSDVYALGIILYQLLAGRRPFVASSAMELISSHMFVEPRRLEDLDPMIPAPLASLVHAMLAKEPTRRPTMRQVADALDQLDPRLEMIPVATTLQRRRRRLVVGASLGITATVAGLVVLAVVLLGCSGSRPSSSPSPDDPGIVEPLAVLPAPCSFIE